MGWLYQSKARTTSAVSSEEALSTTISSHAIPSGMESCFNDCSVCRRLLAWLWVQTTTETVTGVGLGARVSDRGAGPLPDSRSAVPEHSAARETRSPSPP